MSTVLETMKAQRMTERIEHLTRELLGPNTGVHWRYDLLDSQLSPAQYYAVAMRGTGADAEEILVIAIECAVDKDDRGLRLVVSATIARGDGAILAEAENIPISIPSPRDGGNDHQRAMVMAKAVQEAFDRMVDWVDSQADIIHRALRQGAA